MASDDDKMNAQFGHIYDTFVTYDEEEMQRNKRIAKLIVLNFAKYLRQMKLCNVAMRKQGISFRLKI